MPTTVSPDSPDRAEVLRPMGASEQIYHGYMRRNPFQHCLVAHVAGALSSEQVAGALAVVVAAHPLLGAFVESAPGPGRAPAFLAGHAPIPVAVAPAGSTWQEVAAREQADRIDDGVGPLVRAVILDQGRGSADLVLTFDHQGVDAVGALGVLADLAAVLNGASLQPQPVPTAQEDALAALSPGEGAAVVDPAPAPADPWMDQALAVRPFDGTPPVVSSRVVDAELTAAAVAAARARTSTVNSVLVAAAARVLLATGRDVVRVLMPIDLRRAAGVPDVVAIRVLAARVGFTAGSGDGLWAMARRVGEQMARERAAASMQATAIAVSAGAPHASDEAEAIMAASLSVDLELSNLGVVALPGGEGDAVRVTAVDGPVLDTRIAGQQVIGALTCNGELRLCHLAHEPVPGFTAAVVEELRRACTAP